MNDNKLSYSMFIDSNLHSKKQQFKSQLIKKKHKIRHVEQKTIFHWVDDKTVTKCFHCREEFYFLLRKHHCRNCGRIFCYKCSSQFIKIPKTQKISRVCNKCHKRIKQYESIQKIKTIFDLVPFSIKDYFTIACVNKKWYHTTTYYFSKFRSIQYKLHNEKYDEQQTKMLYLNHKYFKNHNIWKLHLFQSISPNDESKIKQILDNWTEEKQVNCWKLMCSRNCQSNLSLEQIILYLDFNDNWKKIKSTSTIQKLLLCNLFNYHIKEIIPYLSILLLFCEKCKFLIDFLFKKACDSNEFAIVLYWELNWIRKNGIYKKLQKQLLKTLDQIVVDKIIYQETIIEYLSINFTKQLTDERIEKMKEYLNQMNFYKNQIPIMTNPYLTIININLSNLKIKSSSSKPILIPLLAKNNQTQKKIKYKMLYKKDDLRKEKIIMNIIVLIDQILQKEEKLQLFISCYNILPITIDWGFIEIIQDSVTLHELKKKNFSIQNFINEFNSHLSIHEIKQRFVMSCSAYCVITYILGIGDRHLENIMITKTGLLFHIDYGFILGEDPKKLLSPEIRITPEMVDMMGGFDSQYYKLFENTCTRAYNCLRRHFNLFKIHLSLLYRLTPAINKYTETQIDNFIIKRFLPNENYEEAKLKFKMKVEKSHKSQYTTSFIDFFHKSKKDINVNKKKSNSNSNSKSGIFSYFTNG